MAEYTLAHVGINANNAGEAMKAAKLFEVLFGLTVKEKITLFSPEKSLKL